jgi:hypothetical protein
LARTDSSGFEPGKFGLAAIAAGVAAARPTSSAMSMRRRTARGGYLRGCVRRAAWRRQNRAVRLR